jgi:hypothetical protein
MSQKLIKSFIKLIEIIPNLHEPSPIVTTHLKIKVVYVCHNATDTLYM